MPKFCRQSQRLNFIPPFCSYGPGRVVQKKGDVGAYLFGINLAKGEIRSKKEAVLVEGEMDVILSHQAGFKNVVACKGTALTSGQIDLLKKYTENLSLCFDMDLAGDSASRRSIELLEKAGMNIKVVEVHYLEINNNNNSNITSILNILIFY